MKTTIVGYPRVGRDRELKFAIEKYWKGEESKEQLLDEAKKLRKEYWQTQKESGLDFIPSNVFSYYDGMLDLAELLNAIPKQYQALGLDQLDTYFAMARGYQGEKGDVKALAMKKWFNTNYHYIVPEVEADTKIKLNPQKLIGEYEEALAQGIKTRPVTVGPYTFLKLAVFAGDKYQEGHINEIITAFNELLELCESKGIEWLQIDEPALVTDQTKEELELFNRIYTEVLKHKGKVKVLLQTYFGDVRDSYDLLVKLPFDGLGLDFVEGKRSLALVEEKNIPDNITLFAGVVNGKNIWKCDYSKALKTINVLKQHAKNIVLSTSCSLLHVPYTVESEKSLNQDILKYFAFAEEKLTELKELAILTEEKDYEGNGIYKGNQELIHSDRGMKDLQVRENVKALKASDFARKGKRSDRQKLQREKIGIPLLPTTTIGSFPQTAEVKKNRSSYRKGEITKEQYDKKNFEFIANCIKFQEEIGLDILVHGEYERNDMVEFFGEHLAGYVFTDKAWVQSYGTRCVKPPIIFGDVKRIKPITVTYSQYAQSLTDKPVKGMLTGPVTILNWSFPREDVSLKEMAFQIGLAIKDEVQDLEKAGIRIIQIDEAALREKLPLRKEDWHSEYLDWALEAFRLCNSGVKEETQIHTHMCYSEFEDIIKDIDNMDADVITFEASRSKLTILDSLKECHFETEVGPGVYDIHSPRVPSVEEIVSALHIMLKKIDKQKLWVNPDCGLKTRGVKETEASLKNLVEAAQVVRKELI